MTTANQGPIPSPSPPNPGSARPSGSHNLASIREAIAIADVAVEKTAKATTLQWIGLGFLGSMTIAVGGFLAWCLITLGVVQAAQAQTAAKADSAIDRTNRIEARVDTIDSGTRVEVATLRKELGEARIDTDKKLTDMSITLQAVLREVKRK